MSSHPLAQEDTPLLDPARDGETSHDESLIRHALDPTLRRTYLWLLGATILGAVSVGWLSFIALIQMAFSSWRKIYYYNVYSDVAFSTGVITVRHSMLNHFPSRASND